MKYIMFKVKNKDTKTTSMPANIYLFKDNNRNIRSMHLFAGTSITYEIIILK